MSGIIYVDLRCLQDPAYQFRGIGYHASALLRARERSHLSKWKTIGLVDPGMPELPHSFAPLVDEIAASANTCRKSGFSIFIDGSPMTHDTRFGLRFQNQASVIKVGVLYDFIPFDWPGYLITAASRIEYLAKLARLRNFDLLCPISEYTAWRLSELAGVRRERMSVTGACVRRSLYEIRDRSAVDSSAYDQNPAYFVTLGGDDKRKNTEVAVEAVQRLNLVYGHDVRLRVIGHYGAGYKHDLLRLAGHSEGAGFLEFCSNVGDEEVVSLHAGAIAAIAPSHIEGFSLPIAEASVCRCPVVASTCAAQMELVDEPEALFQSDDSAALAEKLGAILCAPALRASLVASQAHLGPRFHEEAVGSRFWSAIEKAVEKRSCDVVVGSPRKRRLAFLSPYPPDASNAALYTSMAIKAGADRFDADIFTDAARPLTFESNFVEASKVSPAPILDDRYDGIISVLGNSSPHKRVFEVFERYGGPCILHDVRLTQIYFERLGASEFLRFAGRLLRRSVSMDEVHAWLQDVNPPSLFVDLVIRRASPLMVHTKTQRALIKQRYSVDSHVLTCCPSVLFDDRELAESNRKAVRERRGIPANTFLIASFGEASLLNGADTCILALDLLKSWNIPAELYFIGNAERYRSEVDRISSLYEVSGNIHVGEEFADDTAYRDFLIASDAAVQLRPYGFGQPPTALTDCIGAGLPAVANTDAAVSCDAPSYVAMVPDRFSPLQVGERLALAWEDQRARATNNEARTAYLQTHNFKYYSNRIVDILGMA